MDKIMLQARHRIQSQTTACRESQWTCYLESSMAWVSALKISFAMFQ